MAMSSASQSMGLECWKIRWLEPKNFDLRVEVLLSRQVPVHHAQNPQGILILHLRRQRAIEEVLVADWAYESPDCHASNRGRPAVGCSGEWSPVNHGMVDFHIRRESIEDDSSDFCFKHADQFLGSRQIFVGPVNRRGQ